MTVRMARETRVLAILCTLALVLVACGADPVGSPTAPSTDTATTDAPEPSTDAPEASAPGAEYPSDPIDLVTQSSPGGGADTMARVLAEVAEESSSQPLLVVNRAGAGGANLQDYVNGQPADGYTVITTTSSNLLLYYTNDLQANPATEWRPVIRVMIDPNLLVVNADSPWQTAEEFFEAAAAGDVVFGGGPVGSIGHIMGLLMGEELGFDGSRYTAYPGTGDSYPALLGGQHDATIAQISEVGEFLASGYLRALIVESAIEGLEDVPTFEDLGLQDAVVTQWRGFHVLGDTPDEIVTYLHDAFRAAMEDERWTEYLSTSGSVDGYMGPDEFQALMDQQDETLSRVLTDLGIIGQ